MCLVGSKSYHCSVRMCKNRIKINTWLSHCLTYLHGDDGNLTECCVYAIKHLHYEWHLEILSKLHEPLGECNLKEFSNITSSLNP